MTRVPVAGAWNRRGIQARVMLLVGTGLVAALLIMGWATWTYADRFGRQLLGERELLARVVADRIDAALRADLETLQGVTSSFGDAEHPDADAARTALSEAYLRVRLFSQVFLIWADGGLVRQEPATSGLEPPALADREVQEALRTGRPTVSGLVTTRSGARVVYALVPFRDWLGHVAGVVGGTIQLAGPRLASLLAPVSLGQSGSADVVDAGARVLATTRPDRLFFRGDHAAVVARVIAGRLVAIDPCRDCAGPHGRLDEVSALAPLAAAPWAVAIRQQVQEAFAPAIALRRRVLLLGPALVLLALLFAWGAAQSVRRPLLLLTRSAEEIAAGGLGTPIPGLADDEVGRLGRSLERMRVALKQSLDAIALANQQLEARVQDRTRELERLYRQLQEREEWRGNLLRKVISAQEDERKRIARELHDETSQTLSALAMGLDTARAAWPSELSRQRLDEARTLTVRTLEELHRLIYDLRPTVLDDLGLWSAIRWYAERNLEPLGIAVRCEFDLGGPERRLPPEWEIALFRVVQEAVSNIARHGAAETVLIQGDVHDDHLSIEIEDDGVGFDPATLPPPGSTLRGLGLMGMRERVELLGGRLEIDTAPGRGVRIALVVPLEAEAPHA